MPAETLLRKQRPETIKNCVYDFQSRSRNNDNDRNNDNNNDKDGAAGSRLRFYCAFLLLCVSVTFPYTVVIIFEYTLREEYY